MENYAQFAPKVVSLITVLAKKDKEGFWQLGKSAGTNLAATWILKYTINKPLSVYNVLRTRPF